jgi:hypothetical protein
VAEFTGSFEDHLPEDRWVSVCEGYSGHRSVQKSAVSGTIALLVALTVRIGLSQFDFDKIGLQRAKGWQRIQD